jgi:hypothetical protein
MPDIWLKILTTIAGFFLCLALVILALVYMPNLSPCELVFERSIDNPSRTTAIVEYSTLCVTAEGAKHLALTSNFLQRAFPRFLADYMTRFLTIEYEAVVDVTWVSDREIRVKLPRGVVVYDRLYEVDGVKVRYSQE